MNTDQSKNEEHEKKSDQKYKRWSEIMNDQNKKETTKTLAFSFFLRKWTLTRKMTFFHHVYMSAYPIVKIFASLSTAGLSPR